MKSLFAKSIGLLTATSVVLLSTLSAQSAQANPEALSSQSGSLLTEKSQSFGSLIARETHLFVSSPYEETIRFQGDHAHSLILRLERPLYNYSGDIVVPAGIDIIAQVSRTDDGRAKIVATSLLIEGMEVKLEAVSAPLSVQEVEIRSAAETAQDFNSRYGMAFNVAGDVLFNEDDNMNTLVSNVAPLVGSMFSRAEVEKLTVIPKDRPILLALSERLIIPVEIAQAMQNGSTGAAQFASAQPAQLPQPTIHTQSEQSFVSADSQQTDNFSNITYASAELGGVSLCSSINECVGTDGL